jgi:MoaA/NifB/PqqE/SkfB family radical SAM enzyme
MATDNVPRFDQLLQIDRREPRPSATGRGVFEQRRNEYVQTKVFHHPDRLDHILNEDFLRVVPVSVELDVTNVCPHKCFYCYEFVRDDLGLNWGMHRPGQETDFTRASELLHEMAAAGVKAIEYCGRGEPFAYRRFVDLLNVTRVCGLQAGIITSGSVLGAEIAGGVVEARPAWVRFSIDSLDEETFNVIRQPRQPEAGRQTVIDNITRLANLVRVHGLTTRLSASTVVLPKNFRQLRGLARFTKSLGLRAHVFRLVNLDNRERLYRPVWDEVCRELQELQAELDDEMFSVYLPPKNFYVKSGKPYKKCLFSLYDMAIDVNFNVFGCLENIFNPDYLLGNVGPNGQSFQELLDSPRRLEVMNRVKRCPPCCRDEANEMLEGFVDAIHPNFM